MRAIVRKIRSSDIFGLWTKSSPGGTLIEPVSIDQHHYRATNTSHVADVSMYDVRVVWTRLLSDPAHLAEHPNRLGLSIQSQMP
jgi:hypothetical protein